MVLKVLSLTRLKHLTLRGLEHPLKSSNKVLYLFFPQYHWKCYSEFSTDSSTDIFETVQMKKYLTFLANELSHNSQSDQQIAKLLKDKLNVEEELKSLENMSSEGDIELEKLIETEKKKFSESIKEIKHNLLHSLISSNDENDNRNVELKIKLGIGGEESKLFSEELFHMYKKYSEYKNWEYYRDDNSVLISGENVFNYLKYEAGVHRVQRVPETEKSGRIHTSTCSVIVLPQPKPHEIQIEKKDLIVENIKSSGPGGQNVNKRETCVRIKHIATGIVIENQTERFQYVNLEKAIQRLRGILYNMEQKKISQERSHLIKEQAVTNEYSDKIRTYHYSSNRVTDHRINYSTHSLKSFLEGNKELDWVIRKVKEHHKKRELLLHVESILQSEKYKNFEKHQTKQL